MRRIISGMAYDTDTATFIARGDYDHPLSAAWWSLYRTRNGAFFEVYAGHDGVVEDIGASSAALRLTQRRLRSPPRRPMATAD